MTIKPDHWIRRMALEQRMIAPFEPRQVRGAIISYGLSSYGYDVRLADVFKILQPGPIDANVPSIGSPDRGKEASAMPCSPGPQTVMPLLDPKVLDPRLFGDLRTDTLELVPHSFVLGQTLEYLRIPTNVLTLCVGKSSYARCGVLVNVTPFEPGWEGFATLCIANTGPWPVRLYAGEGIAQVLFFESDQQCEVTYADRQGKYQAQQEITPTRLG